MEKGLYVVANRDGKIVEVRDIDPNSKLKVDDVFVVVSKNGNRFMLEQLNVRKKLNKGEVFSLSNKTEDVEAVQTKVKVKFGPKWEKKESKK